MKRTLQSEENMQNLNETRHKFFLDLCYYCPKYLTREDIRDALLDMKKFAQKVKRMVNGFERVISRIKEEDKRSNAYQKYDLFIDLVNQFEFSLEHLINDPMINSRETCLRFAKLSMRFLRDLNEFIVEVYTYEFTLVYSVPLSWKDAQKKVWNIFVLVINVQFVTKFMLKEEKEITLIIVLINISFNLLLQLLH